jgi:hypothetical protein
LEGCFGVAVAAVIKAASIGGSARSSPGETKVPKIGMAHTKSRPTGLLAISDCRHFSSLPCSRSSRVENDQLWSRTFQFRRSGRRFNWLATNSLIFCDHLGAHQQDQSSNLNTQKHGDRRGEGAVNKLDLRHRGVVPRQNVPHHFPKERGSHTANQCMRKDNRPTARKVRTSATRAADCPGTTNSRFHLGSKEGGLRGRRERAPLE